MAASSLKTAVSPKPVTAKADAGHDEKKGLSIKLEVFEGPLDLLIHLIEKNKIDIYDIQIAVITEQYLAYLKAMQRFDIEIASEFLVMAANLIQIKSRMLLPQKPADADTEAEAYEDDPLRELTDRLLLYREFKQASLCLAQMAKAREQCFARCPEPTARYVTLPEGLTLSHLTLALARLLKNADGEYALVSRDEISVNDKMQDILFLLQKNGGVLEFAKTIFRQGGRSEIIASFLAVLELIRLKKISAVQDIQEGGFSPIFLRAI